ncbi:hypothetical protein AX774_g4479 [Zancudomyces culisetae]|uniref:Uncharacterized protein n=1 Tax=Zancudomyces culisetae TaxID=1213189 RepID=A0A1R1PM55_ZANCU|nr:hypothetical protein AX774_g4479 [Zancudomyces culisetae]|eukprot:OMH82045.1 hypothetical protein AX774_g4479 [Zancudomyces culisetae]
MAFAATPAASTSFPTPSSPKTTRSAFVVETTLPKISANSFPSLPNLSSLFNIAIIFSIISSFTLGKCRINSSIPTPKVPGMSPSCSIFTKLKSVNTPNITSSILDSENIFSPALFKQIAPNPFGIAINTSPEYGICSSIDFKNVCGSLDS